MEQSKIYALEHIGSILSDNHSLMEQFNKKHYADAFNAYSEKCRPVIDAIESVCSAETANRTALLDEVLTRFLDDTDKEVSRLGRFKQKNYLDMSKLILSLYTVPMILHQRKNISEELADLLISKWCKRYPKHSFLKGTYEELLEGFKITRPPFMGFFK